jgi:membrane protein implicated in regulation of membrane protease activity
MIWDIWWVWIAAALGLLILEIFAPGFIFLGFAVGAAVVGLALAIGITLSFPWLLVAGAVISLISWVVMRRAFGIRKGQVKHFDTDINEN